jgi:hypothetical protein
MLDLVVKPAEHEGGEPAAPDIPGGDHLADSMIGIPLWLGAKPSGTTRHAA